MLENLVKVASSEAIICVIRLLEEKRCEAVRKLNAGSSADPYVEAVSLQGITVGIW